MLLFYQRLKISKFSWWQYIVKSNPQAGIPGLEVFYFFNTGEVEGLLWNTSKCG